MGNKKLLATIRQRAADMGFSPVDVSCFSTSAGSERERVPEVREDIGGRMVDYFFPYSSANIEGLQVRGASHGY